MHLTMDLAMWHLTTELEVIVLLKVSLVLGIASVVGLFRSRFSAADRHHVWSIAMLAVLLIPISSPLLPRMESR